MCGISVLLCVAISYMHCYINEVIMKKNRQIVQCTMRGSRPLSLTVCIKIPEQKSGDGQLSISPPKANLPRPRRGGRATVGSSNWQR